MQVKADPYLRQPLGRLRDFGGDDAGECNCRRVVLEVCAGAEAVAHNSDIDLVILDVMMPGMSGVETCTEIRKLSCVPVLFLTAKLHKKWGRGGRGWR